MSIRTHHEGVESLVYAERITALYDRGLIALVANLVNAAILAVALHGAVPSRTLLVWVTSMYVVVLVRLVLWRRQRKSARAVADIDHWARVWLVGTAITGALWGSAGFFLFPVESIGAQDLVVFIIGGMVAGASASMSSFFPAFVAFLVPALAPPTLRLMIENDRTHWAMAILLVSFAIGMTAVARAGERALVGSVRLRFKNARLVDDLSAAREQLTCLNRELEERITARTHELQQAVADREHLVSIVSHELRGPLQSLKLNQQILSRLIDDPALDVVQLRRLLPVLTRQTERMQRLVEDLLDIGRFTADRMHCDKEPIEIAAIVDATIEQLAPQLAVANQHFAVDVEPGLKGIWDPHRLQQVLTNLMFNALTHGAPPFSLSARRADGTVQIVVKDDGPGIPPEHRQRIFHAFERIDWSAGRGPGLGLGLHIAQRIVNAHDGVIRVESEAGCGTSFIGSFPCARRPTPTHGKHEGETLGPAVFRSIDFAPDGYRAGTACSRTRRPSQRASTKSRPASDPSRVSMQLPDTDYGSKPSGQSKHEPISGPIASLRVRPSVTLPRLSREDPSPASTRGAGSNSAPLQTLCSFGAAPRAADSFTSGSHIRGLNRMVIVRACPSR